MKTVLLVSLFAFSSLSFAQGYPSLFSSQRQVNKESTRWTIADYMTQKQRVGMSDMWLAANRSANFFEMYLSGGPVSYDLNSTVGGVTTTTSQNSQSYQVAMYVSIFGLQAEYEKTNHKLTSSAGSLALRLLGMSNQSTNFTVKYGLRNTTDESVIPARQWSNQFAEGELTLYVVDFFGIKGQYRHYFPDKSDTGIDLRGNRATAGVFIDIGFIRLYGDFFQEEMEQVNAGTVTTNEREGIEYGARLYF